MKGEKPKRTKAKASYATPVKRTGATPKTGTKKRKKDEKEVFHTPASTMTTRSRTTGTRRTFLPLKYSDFVMSTLEEEENREEKDKGASKQGAKKKK